MTTRPSPSTAWTICAPQADRRAAADGVKACPLNPDALDGAVIIVVFVFPAAAGRGLRVFPVVRVPEFDSSVHVR